MKQLRVISFNIRNSRSDEGTNFTWDHRKEKVIQIVNHFKPDIVGFQEVFIEQLEYLAKHLNPEYSFQGVGRDDGAKEGEFCPIFFKGLECTDGGTFWYSDTPDICSNTWQMYLPRICTCINFNNSFAFYNTHLDDRDSTARSRSLNLLQKQIDKNSPNLDTIVVGDLNCSPNSQELGILKDRFFNTYWEKNKSFFNNSITSHGFTGRKRTIFALNGGRIIDHILITKGIQIISSKLIYHNVGGHQESYPSDHWPILSDLDFNESNQ